MVRKFTRVSQRGRRLNWLVALGCGVLAVGVGYAVIRSIAAGTPIAFEAESGTVAGTAAKVANALASGGNQVKFGPATPTPTPIPDVVLLAAGDIQRARADLHYGLETANLAKNVIKPNLAILIGDLQYDNGSLTEFNTYYKQTWGTVTFPVYPAPGNHEYQTAGATGYYSYFGAADNKINGRTVTGPAGAGYYAFDVGSTWRIYSMNSEANIPAQSTWLAADMAAHPKACTIMYYHKPYYNYDTQHVGEGDATLPWLKTFYANGGELVLNGHVHNYQRFQPVNPNNDTVDNAKGIQNFVIGSGGADNLYNTPGATAHSSNTLKVTYNGATIGVLKLTLHGSSYDYQFVPAQTGAFTESGTRACH